MELFYKRPSLLEMLAVAILGSVLSRTAASDARIAAELVAEAEYRRSHIKQGK